MQPGVTQNMKNARDRKRVAEHDAVRSAEREASRICLKAALTQRLDRRAAIHVEMHEPDADVDELIAEAATLDSEITVLRAELAVGR